MIRGFNGKNPSIAASAFVSEAAYVVGDVVIGKDPAYGPGRFFGVISAAYGSGRTLPLRTTASSIPGHRRPRLATWISETG